MFVSNEAKYPQKVVAFCFRFVMTPIRLQRLENCMQLEELEGYWLVMITVLNMLKSNSMLLLAKQTTIMLYDSKTFCSTLRVLVVGGFLARPALYVKMCPEYVN